MKAFKEGLLMAAGAAVGAVFHQKYQQAQTTQLEAVGQKYFKYYQLLNQWAICKEENKHISDFFVEEGISTIAVYGLGDLADRLEAALASTEVQILYGIDRDACNTKSKISDVYSLEETWPAVDAIVVTPFCSFQEIEAALKRRCDCRILPLDQIVYSL